MNVAIFGGGDMGATVIEHLQKCALVKTITAYDIKPARLEELQARYHVQVTGNLAQVLGDTSIRLVFVTASNAAHYELTVAALQAGKAVMCEKPMALTLAEAQAMVEAAERTKGFLQIGFELRYSKLYTTIKEWIDRGLLGRVVNIHCDYIASALEKNTWRTDTEHSGSMFGEKLSHYVDLQRWWTGAEVAEVFSICAPNVITYYGAVHDNYHTLCRFQNAAVSELTFMMAPAATFHGDPLRNVINQQTGDGHELRYLVVGTKGAARTDIFGRAIKRWAFNDTPAKMTSTWVENLSWDPQEDHCYFHNTHDQTHDIVRRVAEGLPPKTEARDALQTMRLSFAVDESAANGRIVRLSGPGDKP